MGPPPPEPANDAFSLTINPALISLSIKSLVITKTIKGLFIFNPSKNILLFLYLFKKLSMKVFGSTLNLISLL